MTRQCDAGLESSSNKTVEYHNWPMRIEDSTKLCNISNDKYKLWYFIIKHIITGHSHNWEAEIVFQIIFVK